MRRKRRVLAIDPSGRGFGFAVLEGPKSLVDWGFRNCRSEQIEKIRLKVQDLVNQYRPDLVVTEAGPFPRRHQRTKHILWEIRIHKNGLKVPLAQVSREDVRKVFARYGAETKQELALAVVHQFPELAGWYPATGSHGPPKTSG